MPLLPLRVVPRGVTLLELLIVLVLMAVAAALVLPALDRRPAATEAAPDRVIAMARRTAIRRAEPLRVVLFADGTWFVRSQRSGAVIDSGDVREPLPEGELLVDPLGGCVPTSRVARSAAFDPMACAVASAKAAP